MIPCSELEGDRREAGAETKAARFDAAHDQAWREMQAASPAGAREIFGRLAELKGDKVAGLMADALRKLTARRPWDSAADRAAVEAVLVLLRLAADEMAVEILKDFEGE